jgi:hypothetical protein
MTLDHLINEISRYAEEIPSQKYISSATVDWIKEHGRFAFVKANLEGHITGSMMITNPARTKVLLMLHKKFQRWQQFG